MKLIVSGSWISLSEYLHTIFDYQKYYEQYLPLKLFPDHMIGIFQGYINFLISPAQKHGLFVFCVQPPEWYQEQLVIF